MHFVVVPLSAVPGPVTFTLSGLATQLPIHVVCVGWPMALALRLLGPAPAARAVAGPVAAMVR